MSQLETDYSNSTVEDTFYGPAAPKEESRWTARARNAAWLAASLGLALGVWWLAAILGENELLPTPPEVANTAVQDIVNGSLLQNTWASLYRVLVGYSLGVGVAIPVGFLMGWYRPIRGLVEPWIQFFRVIPPLALIPLVVLFLGIGQSAKIFVIFLAAFLAVVIATFQGAVSVDRTLVDAAHVLGARDRSVFVRIVAPAAFPYILTGARIGLGNAWATLVAAELIAANQGLGYMMKSAAQYYEVSVVVVGVLVIGILGLIMDRILLRMESRLTSWQERREA